MAADLVIRPETSGDISAVRRINERAFGRPGEAGLVDSLRDHDGIILSLVATYGVEIVGHILFSPAPVVGERGEADAVALAPVAVLPEHQGAGVGSALIFRGIQMLREAGHGLVVVLGHRGYYPRFGFVPASRYGIRCPFEVPEEAFRVLELYEGAAPDGGGVVRYRREFEGV